MIIYLTLVSLEGALGNISLNSTKNPKQAIVITALQSQSDKTTLTLNNKLSSKVVLHLIENVYDSILEIEGLQRTQPEDTEESIQSHAETLEKAQTDLWISLQCDAKIPLTSPHPTPSLLLFTKGKKSVSRLVKVLSKENLEQFFNILFNRIECLDVCHVVLGQSSEKVKRNQSYI